MKRRSLSTILLSDKYQEVADTPRVAPLVIVPGDELDELLVQLNTRLCVEDGGSCVSNEVCGDDVLIGILDNALICALRSCLDGSLDFIIGSLLVDADDEVNDGDVNGGDTEGKTAVDRRFIRSREAR